MSDSTSYQNQNPQPPAWYVFLKTFLTSIAIIIPILIVNANIIYFLNAEPGVINKWFPTDCKKYPFGSSTINPCESMELLFSKVCIPIPIIGGSGAKGMYGTMDKLIFGPEKPTEPAFPYKYYSKNYDNVIINYFSWIIGALAKTNVGINSTINFIFTSETMRKCPAVVLLFIGSMFLLLLPFVFGYSVLGNIANKFMGFIPTGLITKLVIFFTVITGGTLVLDLIFGVIAVMSLFMKLVFGPLLVSRSELLKGIARESHIIAFIIGAAFVAAFAKTPLNKNLPSNLIKGILIGFYVFFLLVSVIISISKNI